nr:DMT family transporter [Paenibacillus artemisiicola]
MKRGREQAVKGIVFAVLGGFFIMLQGVANARISAGIGTWQAAALTQLTGFVAALAMLLASRDAGWRELRRVKPLYLIGGAFGAVVIFSGVQAIRHNGATMTTSVLLIAQLGLTFVIDGRGWFGVPKRRMKPPQLIGIGIMIAGVAILGLQ